MPIRSGAMHRPSGSKRGNTLRQRYDEVGLPCSSTIGSPSPTSTYAISRPRTRRRCFGYRNAAEIIVWDTAVPERPAAGIGADANSMSFMKLSFFRLELLLQVGTSSGILASGAGRRCVSFGKQPGDVCDRFSRLGGYMPPPLERALEPSWKWRACDGPRALA